MADITITPVSDITLTIDDGTSDVSLTIPAIANISVTTSVGQGPSGPPGLDNVISFASFASFVANLTSVEDEAFIKVLKDETKQNRQALYVINRYDNTSLSLDFTTDTYQQGAGTTTYDFLAYVQPQYLDPPLNSNSQGFFGAIAADDTYFYYHSGVKWLRIAGTSF